MYTCIILHNMITEVNGFNILDNEEYYVHVGNIQDTWIDKCDTFRRKTEELRDRDMHERLQSDLVEHIYRNRN